MKIAYFDCIAGASGDMILGALLDASLPEQTLRERLAALGLQGFDLQVRQVMKNGIRATKADVIIEKDVAERRLPEILDILQESQLPEGIKEQAEAIFKRLGEVEAGIHGITPDQVHLHELGGVDTIVDVVGALSGLEALEISQVYASPLPLGRGFTRSAHGTLPLPAPATLALLQGVPIKGSELEFELVTPTGAALLSSLATSFGPLQPMTLHAVGYGAGRRDLPIPNVLRVLIGEQPDPVLSSTETLALLETNVDDLNPEIYDYLMARLFENQALDVFFSPIQMKKNRPATLVRVLCQPADADSLSNILFAETSTLGVRKQWIERTALNRTVQQVETPYGPVRVKIARWGEGQVKFAPEYEDCRRLAEAQGMPLRDVYRLAEIAAQKLYP